MRILFALPGLHRVSRGAEIAFEQLARQIAVMPDYQVTLIGSGYPQPDCPYKFIHAPCIPREKFTKWPIIPYLLRGYFVYEELTFVPGLLRSFDPDAYDITVTCSYPYTNWVLRARRQNGYPKHAFVTQNGDWMCYSNDWENRHFDCDGLVCTNPEYFERNCDRYPSVLIPNGVDPDLFKPGYGDRTAFKLPNQVPLVLMVSALMPSKRVLEGIGCVAKLPEVHLAVAGDGTLRNEVQTVGTELLGDRFHWLTVPKEKMPDLYRCADVVLHMSQDEPFGNVYIEALATGLPVVAHDWKVTRWILEEQAIFVDTSNEEAVVDGLHHAFSAQTEMAINNRRNLVESRFSWTHIAEQYCNFFEQICSESSRG